MDMFLLTLIGIQSQTSTFDAVHAYELVRSFFTAVAWNSKGKYSMPWAYMHVFADFGTAPLPGIWDKFLRVCKAMAIVEGVLTLPMPHFVDDNSVIGPAEDDVNTVAEQVGDYLKRLGVPFKELKSRHAATRQLVLGFWWDSVTRTRTLEPHKLEAYLANLREIAGKRSVTSYIQKGKVHVCTNLLAMRRHQQMQLGVHCVQ